MALLPDFGAARFRPGAPIDNPYLPQIENRLASYRETAVDPETGEVEDARIDVLTTTARHSVAGVQVTVVRDTEYEDGLLLEDTLDFFAQDTVGNVWYLGEKVVNYLYDDEGDFLRVDNEGAWSAETPGQEPGWVMKAAPTLGPAYYSEFAPGVALDESIVAGVGETLRTGFGRFDDVVRTIDSSVMQPEGIEYKFYAPGVGLIAERGLAPDGTIEEEAELYRLADVTRRDRNDADDATVRLGSLREGRAVRDPSEVADIDPADFAGGGARHVTILRTDAGAGNALGAYMWDARTGVIGEARILFTDLSDAEAGDAATLRAPAGKVLGLFLVAGADELGLDLGAYADGGLRLVNPLTGAPARIGDALAPLMTASDGSILPVQPLSALGSDDGTNDLNPAAGLHAIGLAARALAGSSTRLIGFEDGAATDPRRDGDFNDAVVAVGCAPLAEPLARRLAAIAADDDGGWRVAADPVADAAWGGDLLFG